MIVSRFLHWVRSARPGDRAEATGALARAFLYSDLSPDDRHQAETALTAMLDDPSMLVRLAMAETFASTPAAPRPLVVALANDAAEVAVIVLRASPVLADCDLVDALALGCERVQAAVAGRLGLSAPVSAALAEIGALPGLRALARNESAAIPHWSLARMVERGGEDGPLREALLARPDLPVDIAQAIAAALAETLGRFVTGCGWLSPERSGRVTREARERTTVRLGGGTDGEGTIRLVDHLRRSGQLTPALILRAVLSGARPFVEAALADLAQLTPGRVRAVLRDERSGAFKALYGKAGLPAALRPAFEAALEAARTGGTAGSGLSRSIVERALAACEATPSADDGKVLALLRRFEAEAARDESRAVAATLADRAALALSRRPGDADGDGAARAA